MTTQQVATMVASIGLPYAYYQFTEETAKAPPFICFYYTDGNDVYADGINYVDVRELVIELYTDNKDLTLEKTVRQVLAGEGQAFQMASAYIESEKMYMTTYTMEVIIDG